MFDVIYVVVNFVCVGWTVVVVVVVVDADDVVVVVVVVVIISVLLVFSLQLFVLPLYAHTVVYFVGSGVVVVCVVWRCCHDCCCALGYCGCGCCRCYTYC